MSIHDRLASIQAALHAPKGQRNDFGKYQYRSAEDILAAVKPLLDGVTLTLSDNMKEIGGRVYVESIASLSDGEAGIATSAFAREALTRKGMDDSQITGSASSYARKYALNGLFAIDNTDDADTRQGPTLPEQINGCFSRNDLVSIWQQMTKPEQKEHEAEFTARMTQIESET